MSPVLIRECRRSWLWGRVAFSYSLEDRRPDLTEEQAASVLGHKYKLIVSFRFFRFRASVVSRSLRPGFLFINGKEVEA